MNSLEKTDSRLSRWVGAAGIPLLIALMLMMSSNLSVILFTPRSQGNGDYYDNSFNQSAQVSWLGILFMIIPVILLFYPWLKLCWSKLFQRARDGYYGLFYAPHRVAKVVAVVLTVLNLSTIILLLSYSEAEAARISHWDYSHSLCPDNSFTYVQYLLLTMLVWGGIYIAYRLYSKSWPNGPIKQ